MPPDRARLLADFRRIRAQSLALCAPLQAEDYRVQSMPDVSPPWWNLGHTSWFFARNVLHEFGGYEDAFAPFEYVLNSYYDGLGPHLPRARRGSVARPTTDAVLAYRQAVDAAMETLLADPATADRAREITTIGLHHEQQHQELLLSEILHIRFVGASDLRSPYRDPLPARPTAAALPLRFVDVAGGLTEIGAGSDTFTRDTFTRDAFAWDNERPRHRAWVDDFALANRPVTCGEWLDFMSAGGYRDPLLWLSNGWTAAQENGWQAPMYWREREGAWEHWTLRGWQRVDPLAPVCHVSFYEAEAFARWSQARLPSEREWEHAAQTAGFATAGSNLLDDDHARAELRPLPAVGSDRIVQLAGDVWEWTTSHYEPYPRFRPFDGALMEYNGKFMDNQRVLRGGSFATPRDHIRATYRNFWPADTRFQFTGLRLAR